MRVSVFVLSVLAVFTALAYTIWLESAIVVEAYKIRELREEEAEMGNQILIRKADLARRLRPANLEVAAEKLGMSPMKRNVAKVVVVPDSEKVARGAD